MTTDSHGRDAAPIRPCDLARVLQDGLRSLEQALRSLGQGSQLPADAAAEIGDARRFVACAHEEARQLAVLMTASARAAAWTEDLREAVPSAARQQAAHAGAPAARLRAVLDVLGPLKVAASALAFAMGRRAPRAAVLHLARIERWLLVSGVPMTRAIAIMDASASGHGPAAAETSAEPCDPEPAIADRPATPSRRTTRPHPAPGKRLL